jgi:DNA repair exonuclease SbcCD ATPase subunit
MKIIQLQAENIKKLSAIDITPTDSTVLITGPNGAGKSSILDCIIMALCGGKSIPAVPIKKGADKGKIVIDLGDYTITRSFTKENSYLKIEAKDGSNISSPQKFLYTIVGNISFDPLDFLNNEKLKQRNILLQLLGVNVDELDRKEKNLREARATIGRDVSKAKALFQSIEAYPSYTQTEEISVSDLSAKIKEAMDSNAALDRQTQANENLKAMAKRDIDRITLIDRQITDLQTERASLSEAVEERKQEYITTRNRLAATPLINISDLQADIANVEDANRKIRANLKKVEAKAEFDAAETQYNSLTKQIEAMATERQALLSNAAMPVAGLSFDDGGLLYNSIPLDQCSDGEKLMVSLGISMALNPTLRVLRIKDGSLLDARNRETIKSMVAEKDYQLWFESVGSDSNVGILIEEGQVVSIDGQEVIKPAPALRPPKAKKEEAAPLVPPVITSTTSATSDEEGW